MKIREIKAELVTETVKKLFMDCNYFIGDDIMCALKKARDEEESDTAKNVLSQIIENDEIAAAEEIPLCQDTGMAVLFVEYGDKVVIDGDFEEAVQEGVRRAYIDGYLRKSVVDDPIFDRVNTKDNTPAIIHTKIVSGDKIKITAERASVARICPQSKCSHRPTELRVQRSLSLTQSERRAPIPVPRLLSASEWAEPLSAALSSRRRRPSVP